MSVDGFRSAVDDLKKKLELLEEAWLDLQRCDSLDNVCPLCDDVWNDYLSARTDAEQALSRLAQEIAGFYVLAQISDVHVEEGE